LRLLGMEFVNVQQYNKTWKALREEYEKNGVVLLTNFLTPSAISKIVEQSLAAVKDKANNIHYSDNTHNPYLQPDDDTLLPTHPKRFQVKSSKSCITYDQIPEDSPIRQVYEWSGLIDIMKDLLNLPEIYLTADALGALNIHVYHEGDELGWHFDNGEFAVTLLLQEPIAGGLFQYVPNIRKKKINNSNEEYVDNFEEVSMILNNPASSSIINLDIQSGSLVLFRGKDSLHRVTKVIGKKERIIAVLSFETKPGVVLNEYTRMKFYGRAY